MILEIPILSLNNANIKFPERKQLIWRLYTIVEALPITNRIKPIDKREFTKVTLD